MTFPTYPEYKNSGVEWLAEVPEHWTVMALKYLTYMKGRIGFRGYTTDDIVDEGEGAITLSPSNFTGGKVDFNKSTYITWDKYYESPEIQVSVGDTIIVKTGSTYGKVAFVESLPLPTTINPQLAIFKTKSIDKRFLFFMTISTYFNSLVKNSNSGSAMPTITQESVLSFVMAVPPALEQTQIARFLDHETARIDTLIEEQQRLMEVLKEKRHAVISHAVTKGLDPKLPMKDSGVEWLGEVPAHWNTVQVGRVCRKVSDGPHFSPNYVDEGVMFLSARNVAVDGWHLEDAKFISEDDYSEFCRRIVPEKGDVLYTKGGTTGIARVVDLEEKFQVWVHIAVLKLDRELIDPHYMAFSLNSIGCYEQSQLHTRGATNQDLGLTRMIKIWFALPPREEQIRICEFLNPALNNIDELITEATKVVGLLGERRSALISAAVTGKIDVRGWQPPARAKAPAVEVEEAV